MPDKVYDMEKSCKRLKELCDERGMTAANLADSLGVTRQAVYSWFNARKAPSVDHICEIAEIFQVSTDEFMVRRERNGK